MVNYLKNRQNTKLIYNLSNFCKNMVPRFFRYLFKKLKKNFSQIWIWKPRPAYTLYFDKNTVDNGSYNFIHETVL